MQLALQPFDPSCVFLLGLPYENLYEELGPNRYRCKGCQAILQRKSRKDHFDKHVLQHVPDKHEQEVQIKMQLAEEVSRLQGRIAKHEEEAKRAADKHARVRAKAELLIKPGRTPNAKEQALLIEADELLRTSAMEAEAAQRLRAKVNDLQQEEEAERRLILRVRKRVKPTRRRATVPTATKTKGGRGSGFAAADVPAPQRNKIVALFKKGVGVTEIADEMHNARTKPPGGGEWERRHVLRVLYGESGATTIGELRRHYKVKKETASRTTAKPKNGTARKNGNGAKKKTAAKPRANGTGNGSRVRGGKRTTKADPKPGGRKRSGGKPRRR